MQKRLFVLLGFFVLCSLVFFSPGYSAPQAESNPIIKFLRNVEYTSRFKIEYDDNIFLTEDNQDTDLKEIFTQTLTYKLSKDNQYFQLGYNGNYAFYSEESTGLLGHTANLLYSYRPFNGFSIGIRDDYNWLQDSKIASTIGDRVLALGYIQNVPSLEIKYEASPQDTFITDTYYQFLDVTDPGNDDYIDNKRVGVRGQLNHSFTPKGHVVGFLGFEHRQITFPQIAEKASVSDRPFVGLTEKVIGLFNATQEIGFDRINFEDPLNNDDHNVDYKFSVETIFSLYTKLRLSYDHNLKNSSFRRQYTQYGSNIASFNLSHAINLNTAVFLDYSYERQEFNSSDTLIGQAKEDKDTSIQNLKLTLSRKLMSWLTLDVNYGYTKRDTDFLAEGYTDNKVSIAITTKY